MNPPGVVEVHIMLHSETELRQADICGCPVFGDNRTFVNRADRTEKRIEICSCRSGLPFTIYLFLFKALTMARIAAILMLRSMPTP